MTMPEPVRPIAGVEDLPGAADVIMEARKRFRWCAEWESNARARFIDDYKFANGDSDNGYQWPNSIRRNRDVDQRPCLTMNLIRQHNLIISNEARKNKASPKVVGTGNGATEASAGVFRDVCRYVELKSRAQEAYTMARKYQIDGGIGFWRLITKWATPDSFDQEVAIMPVPDPLSIYLDPDINQLDGSDARFGFAFDNVPKDEFDDAYPEWVGIVGENPLGIASSDDDWVSREHVRVCEYFRKVTTDDRVISFLDSNRQRKTMLESQLPENVVKGLLAQPLTKTRPTKTEKIEWYLIAGDSIVDHTIWVGKYIPLVRIIGEEIVIEGILDRKGHTRAQKDAQRMYNYNASAQVEFVALQGKTPWIAAAAAIEEYETMWNTANVVNHSVLIYNAFDDQGNPMEKPERTPPPGASPAYATGMETAFNQIMMVSGQWQNAMGMAGNERTGKAIGLRQEQSATATFHFQDNYEVGLKFTATMLIDLVPKVYDSKRILSIMAEDGATYELVIDPGAKQAYAEQQAENGQAVQRIFNPRVGMYDVAPSVGPAYGTKREEARDMLTLILTQAKELTPVIGDLLVGDMDFDSAKEAARRLKRMVPAQALGTGPTQNEQALEAKITALTTVASKALEASGKAELRLVGKDQMRDIDAYDANTKRLVGLKDFLPVNPEGLEALISNAVREALKIGLSPIVQANANDIDVDGPRPAGPESSPEDTVGEVMPPGAKKARDGKYYMEDPARRGKYLRVERRVK